MNVTNRTIRVEQIGNATLYLGDCLEVRPTLQGFDAIVTDPPYGQSYKVNTFYKNGARETAVIQRNGKFLKMLPNLHEEIEGDNKPFDPTVWLDAAPEILMWGAHKFADRLPAGGWLVWDKVPTGKTRDQGDGEAAWINRDMPMRIFRLLWDGVCVGVGARHEVTAGQKRLHPMQKPEVLMKWCLGFIKGRTILDPYMGSGSTGVACAHLGRPFIGIESVPKYFEIACRRIREAQKVPLDMFTLPPAEDPADTRIADLFREPET